MSTALPISSQSNSASLPKSCKATIFKIAGHWLALPATAILKVIPYSTSAIAQQSKLTVWNNHSLVHLDLHPLLTRVSTQQIFEVEHTSLSSQKYMMIVWSQTGEQLGILVDELPVLYELSLSKAQTLPPHYRRTIHNIAKYVIIQPHQGEILNILLLDLQQALGNIASF